MPRLHLQAFCREQKPQNGLSARRDVSPILLNSRSPHPAIRCVPAFSFLAFLFVSPSSSPSPALPPTLPLREQTQNPRLKADIKRSSRNQKVSERMVGSRYRPGGSGGSPAPSLMRVLVSSAAAAASPQGGAITVLSRSPRRGTEKSGLGLWDFGVQEAPRYGGPGMQRYSGVYFYKRLIISRWLFFSSY